MTNEFMNSSHSYDLLDRSRLSMVKIPEIKATVANIIIEYGVIYFKIIVSKNGMAYRKTKKSFQDIEELDQIIDKKYSKLIKDGYINKGILPHKDNYNFNNIQ